MIESALQNVLKTRQEFIEEFLNALVFVNSADSNSGLVELQKSMRYTLLQKGKRFRPVLCLLLAEEFAGGPQKVLPFAAAVELIHTYSLIHDDLPAMDNDDLRRGQPTNHKIFGEAMALLAGDALQSEAFSLIANGFPKDPQIAIGLVQLLSEACGARGMVGGQAIDIRGSATDLRQMHALKTGALIRVCCEGTAVILGLPEAKQKLCRKLGEEIGFAFQLADDLLDSAEEKIEKGSFPDRIGLPQTKLLLDEVTAKARSILLELGIQKGALHELVEFNQNRRH